LNDEFAPLADQRRGPTGKRPLRGRDRRVSLRQGCARAFGQNFLRSRVDGRHGLVAGHESAIDDERRTAAISGIWPVDTPDAASEGRGQGFESLREVTISMTLTYHI
jgi:hypothetical protein